MFSFLRSADFVVTVVTGDVRGGGTNANVYIELTDDTGKVSQKFCLDNTFSNDFEQGQTDNFDLKNDDPELKFGDIKRIALSRDEAGWKDTWFVDRIIVKNVETEKEFIFPVIRWVKPDSTLVIDEFDTALPQLDPQIEYRKKYLEEKRKSYQLTVKNPAFPPQVKELPNDENFSFAAKFSIFSQKTQYTLQSLMVKYTTKKWTSLEDLTNVYTDCGFPLPAFADSWQDDDTFSRQRTHGCSIGLLKLCTEIPSNLAVTDEMLAPFIEKMTISDAISRRQLFIVNLSMMKGLIKEIKCHIASPIALFFETSGTKVLKPIAIQLEQDPDDKNPVFLPSDPQYTWLMAKMWYNNADAMYHQACTHLGFTHLLMEGVTVTAHRNLGLAHPIYKLLAPHCLYLLAINSRALEDLVAPGGWIDRTMSYGSVGLANLVKDAFDNWRLDTDGTLPADMVKRGLTDGALVDFPYRDDGMLLYNAIEKYVERIVNLYYDTPEKLKDDYEIQAWAKEMVQQKGAGGLGLKGVPGNGTFEKNSQLIDTVTPFIYIGSVAHAACNFPQYDNYAFPPVYPAKLEGTPPTTKEPLKEEHIINALPDKDTTLETMVITRILSERGTKSLGDFEVDYTYDPPAVNILEQFRKELKEISKTIETRNKTRVPYTILKPDEIPNAISI